jgi:hypothetical protein
MAGSFDWVDEKLREADYFFTKMNAESANPAHVRYNFSAFVSAGRSVTFAIQAVMQQIDGLECWYAEQREALRADPLARYFITARNDALKNGLNPAHALEKINKDEPLSLSDYFIIYFWDEDPPDTPRGTLYDACLGYMTILVTLVHSIYLRFGPAVDPQQYYTTSHLSAIGRTVEDVVEEIMGIERGFFRGSDEEDLLRQIREQAPTPCIDHIFVKYLRKDRFGNAVGPA